jgi:hypothetical protein
MREAIRAALEALIEARHFMAKPGASLGWQHPMVQRNVMAAKALESALAASPVATQGDAKPKPGVWPRAVHQDALYEELLYAVGNKYPGESRHETALRYIRQAEAPSVEQERAAMPPIHGEGEKAEQPNVHLADDCRTARNSAK